MMSPCVRVCRLGPDDRCEGCGRTVGEIRGWASMTKDERWAVMKRLASEGYFSESALGES
ncbi:MAG: DUF1289 domain-containing protein [Rhodospirillales bacterium]|nr:DUF1289 domain-containing protein [Rhodospirillales bacterium]